MIWFTDSICPHIFETIFHNFPIVPLLSYLILQVTMFDPSPKVLYRQKKKKFILEYRQVA